MRILTGFFDPSVILATLFFFNDTYFFIMNDKLINIERLKIKYISIK
jgi:hypothetical protein